MVDFILVEVAKVEKTRTHPSIPSLILGRGREGLKNLCKSAFY